MRKPPIFIVGVHSLGRGANSTGRNHSPIILAKHAPRVKQKSRFFAYIYIIFTRAINI